MGTILDHNPDAEVFGEARRESFSVYTEFGKEGVELDWRLLPHLVDAVKRMEKYARSKKLWDKAEAKKLRLAEKAEGAVELLQGKGAKQDIDF